MFANDESLALLKNKLIWEKHYQTFLAEMVYDSSTATEYEKAINTIEDLTNKIIESLSYPSS